MTHNLSELHAVFDQLGVTVGVDVRRSYLRSGHRVASGPSECQRLWLGLDPKPGLPHADGPRPSQRLSPARSDRLALWLQRGDVGQLDAALDGERALCVVEELPRPTRFRFDPWDTPRAILLAPRVVVPPATRPGRPLFSR